MDVEIKRAAVISELQDIRADRRAYQSHKESTVYIAVALSAALLGYLVDRHNDSGKIITWAIVVALLLNHLFIRWQLRLRRHASAWHWVVEKVIAKAIVGEISDENLEISIPTSANGSKSRKFSPRRLIRQYAFGEQLERASLESTVTFKCLKDPLVAHFERYENVSVPAQIKRSLSGYFQGGELPTLASLLTIFFALGIALGAFNLSPTQPKDTHTIPTHRILTE